MQPHDSAMTPHDQPEDDGGQITRGDLLARQQDELPGLAVRLTLVPNPKTALEAATMEHAMELSSIDILESGREFVEVPDEERMAILMKNYEFCAQRNARYIHVAREQRN